MSASKIGASKVGTNGRVRKQAERFGNVWFLCWRRVVCRAPLNSWAPAFVPSTWIPSSWFGYVPEFSPLLQGKHYFSANASVPFHLILFVSHSSTCLLCVLWGPTTRSGYPRKMFSPHVILVAVELKILSQSCSTRAGHGFLWLMWSFARWQQVTKVVLFCFFGIWMPEQKRSDGPQHYVHYA